MKWRRFDPDEELPEEPLVNLTPLIDVVFVVLICFMLIAPVLDIDIVELATSGAQKEKGATESSPFAIVVRADNSIWMQGRPVSLQELEKFLLVQKKLHPKDHPQVIHDKNASFGTYQMIKNVLERCGFEQMDILLKPN